MNNLIPAERIENRIFLIRGLKVMLDFDLAELYKVKTKALNQGVRRNIERFPNDFMFKLTKSEVNQVKLLMSDTNLKSQFVTSSWGGRRKPPLAFSEQGVAMLSSILNSKRAIQVNIAIMRTFIRLRQILATHKDLEQKLLQLEERFEKKFKDHDYQIQAVFDAIKKLMMPPDQPKRKIGFLADR